MILYHGSLEIVQKPEIRKSARTLDYGYGFYLTTSKEQALRWVQRRMREQHCTCGYINVYDFDEVGLDELSVKAFAEPSDEWVDFVQLNRMNCNYDHNYDLVCGSVANDKVYTSFALYEGGVISKRMLIAELKTYKLVDQYLFHTEIALNYLSFKEAKEVTA